MAKKSISKVSRMRRPTIKPSGMDAPDMAASDMAAPAMPTEQRLYHRMLSKGILGTSDEDAKASSNYKTKIEGYKTR